ncbi:MAG: type II secretion system F family protein [DPANN group archaeon]|nr:type II secretion system F family protein [DPANN group archaeon]
MSVKSKSYESSKKETTLEDEENHLELLRQHLNELGLSTKKTDISHNETSIHLLLKEIIASRNTENLYTAFGKYLYAKTPKIFKKLNSALVSSDYNSVIEIYIGKMFLFSFVSLLFSTLFFGTAIYFRVPGFDMTYMFYPIIVSILIFVMMFYIPFEKTYSKKKSINTNLPFALTHLSAIASSGTPPEEAFRIMSEFSEFGDISAEMSNITGRIDVFGEDITIALKHVISTTPSESMREILGGILTITQTGGNLDAYLTEMADIAMFDYRLSREKYLSALSTYADMYTALLIAAPLFLVSILVVMNIIPDTSLPGGIGIMTALSIGVYGLIPLLNLLFLAFITFTAPEM